VRACLNALVFLEQSQGDLNHLPGADKHLAFLNLDFQYRDDVSELD